MGIWFALPCGTFSSARRNDGKGPKPLRSKKYVTGFPSLTGRDKKRVGSANELVQIVTKLCELCTQIGVPWVIENPRSSLIWQMPSLKKLATKSKAEFSRYDSCQFGTDWQKPTVLMVYGNPLLKINQVRCDPTKTGDPDGPSICSKTQKQHTLLKGTITMTTRSAQPLRKPDKSGKVKEVKQFLTNAAEPYPKKICDHWSACIHFNWRYKNSELTRAQMELSQLQFPKEWIHGDSDESAKVTLTKIIEKPPEPHYLTHFPKHLGCESCFKTKHKRSRTGGRVKTLR